MNELPPLALPPPTHEALLGRIAEGDRVAFRQLYDATAPRLHGLALRLLQHTPSAEEVVQEVFLAVWRHAGTFDPARGPALPWMARILRNRVADRRRRRELPLAPLDAAQELPDPALAPEALAGLSQEAAEVAAALATLPPRMRACIEMAYFDQAGYREIAERFGVSVNTVKSWVRRALIRLRGQIDPAMRGQP